MIIRPKLSNVGFIFDGLLNMRSNWSNWDPNRNPVYKSVSTEEIANIRSRIDMAIYQAANSTTRDLFLAETLGKTFTDDEGGSKPTPIISTINVKNGIKHKDFEARKRAGEILMSDYDRQLITVHHYPGINQETSFTGYPQGNLTMQACVDWGLAHQVSVNGKTRFLFLGTYLAENSWFDSASRKVGQYNRESSVTPLWVYPPFLSAESIPAKLLGSTVDTTSMVTNVLAKANTQSLDILTAAAELPKLIGSFYKSAKVLTKMLTDFKKKKFNLSKAYERKEQRMTAEHRKRILQLDRRLQRQKNLSNRKKQELMEYKARLDMGLREGLKETALEATSALADLWLTYRYSIMTNVYTAQDAYDAVQTIGKQFVTAKGKLGNERAISLGVYNVFIDETVRVVIKRRFSAAIADSGLTAVSSDIFVTAWELVPLSWVADWFVNIGDFLKSQNYNYKWDDQKATMSHMLKVNDSIVLPEYASWSIPPRTVIRCTVYQRRLFYPNDCTGLVFKPSIGLERKLDALSLGWSLVRSSLNKRK